MRPTLAAISTTCILAGMSLKAQEIQPLSAIDWLSQSVTIPVTPALTPPALNEPPVANSATAPQVITTPLDGQSLDPIGLLTADVTGLPLNLWSGSEEQLLVQLLKDEPIDGMPAMQDLLKMLLLAQADPPLAASPNGGLFLARIDKLLDLGALAPVQDLLDQSGAETPALFRRWFDVALLTGTEDSACRVLQNRIDVAPTYAARIFCLARGGDWAAAALTLNTHTALGDISEDEEALLARFLDPELFEDAAELAPPPRISPLVFRMREAIGEGMTTTALPRAFAHADLRNTVGWKSQLEAAERLTRHGAIAPNVLFNFYGSRTPSASGGIWDRAKAVQRLDAALRAKDIQGIADTLSAAWQAAIDAKVEVAFATTYAPRLRRLNLPDGTAAMAEVIGLLSPGYEDTALVATQSDPFLLGLARGETNLADAQSAQARAITAAFTVAEPPPALTQLAEDQKLGEAILRAISLFDAGIKGDNQSLTDALAFLRSIGLEDVARRASLQLLLLDRET